MAVNLTFASDGDFVSYKFHLLNELLQRAFIPDDVLKSAFDTVLAIRPHFAGTVDWLYTPRWLRGQLVRWYSVRLLTARSRVRQELADWKHDEGPAPLHSLVKSGL